MGQSPPSCLSRDEAKENLSCWNINMSWKERQACRDYLQSFNSALVSNPDSTLIRSPIGSTPPTPLEIKCFQAQVSARGFRFVQVETEDYGRFIWYSFLVK